MCTGAEIGLGLAIGSQVLSGFNKAQASRQEAALAAEDARLAEEMAKDSERRGEVDAAKIRDAGARVRGSQVVAFSSGNIDPSSGSAAAVQEGTAAISEQEALEARLEGQREAYGYRTQGTRFQAVASARRQAALNYAVATGVRIAGTTYQGGTQLGWWQTQPSQYRPSETAFNDQAGP